MACKLYDNRQRRYFIAIVKGHVEFTIADIEFAVGIETKTADSSHRMLAINSKESLDQCLASRPAHTRVLLLETGQYDKHPVSILLLKPITGRRHQLRVHCNAIGHPIVGDSMYNESEDIQTDGMFLHSRRLLLVLLKGETLNLKSKEPFFSDPKFSPHYKSEQTFYKYCDDNDFDAACDVLDNSDLIGIQYKKYQFNDM